MGLPPIPTWTAVITTGAVVGTISIEGAIHESLWVDLAWMQVSMCIENHTCRTMAAVSLPGEISSFYIPKFGMFAEMQTKVLRNIGNDYITELKALSTHLDTFKYIQNLPSVRDVIQLPDNETLNGKNPDVARTRREKGNALFAKKNMR